MTVDEFLSWADTQPGRYELDDGEIVGMAPERIRHARTKSEAHQN
jgi:Uma2 family endonuclease